MYTFTENDIVFMWLSGYKHNKLTNLKQYVGPFYTSMIATIGSSYFHTLEDLLKLSYSKTIQKQLSSAREGTIVDVGYAHSNANHLLRRMKKEEIESILEAQKTQQELTAVEEEIKQQTKTLQVKKTNLSTVLKKQNKELEKTGIKQW